jgi:hypothetical protein
VITKIFFRRTQTDNKPTVTLVSDDGSLKIFNISEAEYDFYVPETNHFHGENLREGITWEKPFSANLKGELHR